MVKKLKLDRYEQEIEKALVKGEFVQVKNVEAEKKKLMLAAQNTFKKMRNINLRVSTMDLMRLRTRAEETGIPYQTLVRSLIRQYTNGQLQLQV